MTDVRLTATNPADSSVVPVACNEKGELKLEEPQVTSDLYVEKAGGTMTGPLTLSSSENDGWGANSGRLFFGLNNVAATGYIQTVGDGSGGPGGFGGSMQFWVKGDASNPPLNSLTLNFDGVAEFEKDVIIGSRGEKWMIVESNGLAHLVAQTQTADIETADLAGEIQYPPLRDIPGELTMVEQQLQKVLEKLRMIPEAGWEVWDGSD